MIVSAYSAVDPGVLERRLSIPETWDNSCIVICHFGEMFTRLKSKINEVAPDLQFRGYEGGNVLAAVAGVGGFFCLL